MKDALIPIKGLVEALNYEINFNSCLIETLAQFQEDRESFISYIKPKFGKLKDKLDFSKIEIDLDAYEDSRENYTSIKFIIPFLPDIKNPFKHVKIKEITIHGLEWDIQTEEDKFPYISIEQWFEYYEFPGLENEDRDDYSNEY